MDKKFSDVRDMNINLKFVNKAPNTVMNDYTKNISQPIFSPGIYRTTDRLKEMADKFVNTDFRLEHMRQKAK